MTSVHPNLNPEAIFKRGFVTKEEAESVELSEFASKINLEDENGEREGIWVAFITEEDRALYNSKSKNTEIRCILLNHALMFYPNPTWGRMLIGKTNGEQRPIFKQADQVEHLKNTHEAYLKEYPPKEKDDQTNNG